MATVESRLTTLETAVTKFVSRAQILALINSTTTQGTTNATDITELQTYQALILDEIQAIKARLDALEA